MNSNGKKRTLDFTINLFDIRLPKQNKATNNARDIPLAMIELTSIAWASSAFLPIAKA